MHHRKINTLLQSDKNEKAQLKKQLNDSRYMCQSLQRKLHTLQSQFDKLLHQDPEGEIIRLVLICL